MQPNAQGSGTPVLNAFNEWGPLEEVVVGIVGVRSCHRRT